MAVDTATGSTHVTVDQENPYKTLVLVSVVWNTPPKGESKMISDTIKVIRIISYRGKLK